MNESDRLLRNEQRLTLCYPPFALRARQVISALEDLHFRPRIQEAWRSLATHEQQKASGVSWSKWSFHCAMTPSGKPDSLAVDLLDDDYPAPGPQHDWPASFRRYLVYLAAVAVPAGLETGIQWSLHDPKLDAEIARVRTLMGTPGAQVYPGGTCYTGEFGVDPTHLEPGGHFTMAAAMAGRRPWTT